MRALFGRQQPSISGADGDSDEDSIVPLSSMTGFARAEGQVEGFTWAWEIKSVNSKSLDLRFRLPPGFDIIEGPLKARAAESLRRGSISASLNVNEAKQSSVRINEEILNQVIGVIESLEGQVDAAPPRLDGLLQIRGVMDFAEQEVTEQERAARIAAVTLGFDAALADLITARDAEGERLGRVLGTRLDEIATLVADAEQSAAAQPSAIRARFNRQIAELFEGVPPLPDERLAQEVAMLIQRADIREELDRLTAHSAAARDYLAEGVGVGRRLDFLCQEFNREANTLCSKSTDLGLTKLGLSLKATIEQLREQVQNIE